MQKSAADTPQLTTLVPLWTQVQIQHIADSAIGHASDYFFVPLNQHVLQAAMEAGLPIDPDKIIALWDEAIKGDLLGQADGVMLTWLKHKDRTEDPFQVLVWRAALEAAFIERVLDCAGGSLESVAILLYPTENHIVTLSDYMRSLPSSVVRDYAAEKTIGLSSAAAVNMDLQAQNNANNQTEQPVSGINMGPIDCVLMTYGMPDLGQKIEKCAQHYENVLVVSTPDCRPNLSGIRDCVALYDTVTLKILGQERQMTSVSEVALPLDSRIKDLDAVLAAEITEIFETQIPQAVWMAHHMGPASFYLKQAAIKTRADLTLFEHSPWPLRPMPFSFQQVGLPPKGRHVFYTRDSLTHFQSLHPDWPLQAELEQPKGRMRRKLKNILRHLAITKQPINIGMVVTTGQAYFAPELSIQSLYDDIAKLCKVLSDERRGVRITVRLRDRQDSSDILLSYLRRRLENDDFSHISFSLQTEQNFHDFARSCSRIIELGVPSSATLEAMSYGVPCYRMAGTGDTSSRFGIRPLGHISSSEEISLLFDSKKVRALRKRQAAYHRNNT